jgi:replication-associated recombination protein RarA
MADLFEADPPPRPSAETPLAERLRPATLAKVIGQEHLTGEAGAIGRMVAAGRLSSLILWGPPGIGKTSIARLLADAVGYRYTALSASSAVSPISRRRLRRPRHLPARANAPCCSWTRSTASTAASRMVSCPMSKQAR